jgi:hypothetical protein
MTEQLRSALDSDFVEVTLRIAALIAIPWGAWVTKSLIDLNSGGQFSSEDAYRLELRLDRRFDALPPADWRMRIENMETELRELRRP